jgi:alpha-mannosidase
MMTIVFPDCPRAGGGMRRWLLLILVAAAFGFPAVEAGAQAEDAGKPVLYYIPHTHWEAAVFKTREDYLPSGFANILQALRLLKQYPEYKFTLDQAAYVKPFLERYPEEAAAFRQFVAERRLGIVGGMDVMPDVVKPGGELFVRQMQYGKRYFREELGVDVTVAWLLDTFGHHAQMPQLLREAGFESFWFCRGVPHRELPSEFRWRGLDGTEIPAFWLPGFYGLFYGPPRGYPEFVKFFQRGYDSLTPHARGRERVGLAGVDVSEPEDYVPPLVAQFNRQTDAPFTIRYALPDEFAAVVARRASAPVITSDFNPIFQGTYSSRIELKQITRRVEQLLLTAEKLSAIAQLLGTPADDAMLWRAWEPVLFNQTHDLASGVMTDGVYDDTLQSYEYSQRLAREMIDSRSQSVAGRIDTRGVGIPVVVFNPVGWSRDDVAEVDVGFEESRIGGVRLLDSRGQETPVQIAESERYGDRGLKRARLAFLAREVPALGYATYRVFPLVSAPESKPEASDGQDSDVIENEYYRLRFNLKSGEITELFDKKLAWQVLSGPANVVTRQEDHGDLWELYHGLDGGSHVAMTNQQAVPDPDKTQFSRSFSDKAGSIRRGPVFSEFSVAHPFANGTFATRVRLYAGLKRIDIRTELVNQEKYVRYQALFPTSIQKGQSVQEIPFGCLDRPSGIEFPAQNWVDYHDGQRGVALLNFGLPGNVESEGTLMLSLLRSHNLGQYGFGGGYEPGMSSESGFELGKTRTFDYAVIPHAGDWRQAAVYRQGMEFNHPLVVSKTTPHAGTLPARWGLLEITRSNVVLTACKPGRDGSTVLRVYEAAGQPTAGVTLKFNWHVGTAWEANLLEDAGHRMPVRDDTLQFDLHPFQIKTIKLTP